MRVWITRTQPEATATAARVHAKGHAALVSPVLRVEPSTGPLDLEDVRALAFSSRHAVDAFAASSEIRALPVFVTGRATAQAARLAGFGAVQDADGDGRALAALIARSWGAKDGTILHPAAAEPAFDLAAALARHGLPVRTYAAYRTLPLDPTVEVTAALTCGAVDAVLVHSAKAAGEVARLLSQISGASPSAYAISPSVAEALAGAKLSALHVPERPTETALLDLLPAPSPETSD